MNRLKQSFARHRFLYLLLVPSLLYFFIFTYYPLSKGVVMSFQDFRFMGDSPFTGWDNYREVFRTPGFYRVLVNTLILGLGSVFLTALVPLITALLLNEIISENGRRLVQTVIYLPYVFSWVIVGGIWVFMLSPQGGLVNGIRELLGLKSIYYLAETQYARPLFILANLWKQLGYITILFTARLQGIDPQLYEAARMDGASALVQAVKITLPELRSTLKIVFLLNTMGALQMFNQIYVMRNDAIAHKVDVLMYYVYTRGFDQFKFGYAAAISVLIFTATLGLSLLVKRGLRYSL